MVAALWGGSEGPGGRWGTGDVVSVVGPKMGGSMGLGGSLRVRALGGVEGVGGCASGSRSGDGGGLDGRGG